MKGLRWGLGALAAVVLALVAVPALVPLEGYKARIERTASERLKRPVTIGKLTVAVLPTPHFTATDVSIGESDALGIGTVVIRPRVTSLLAQRKAIRVVELRDVAASQSALQQLVMLAAPGKKDDAPMQVEKIVLGNALVKTARGEIGPLRAEIALTSSGEPDRATLTTADGRLRAELTPERGRYAVSIHASDWKLPWGPGLVFESLRMAGNATATEAHFDDVSAELYGGQARGAVRFGWGDGVRLSGDFDLKQVELAELMKAFSAKSRISGRLDAKPVFRARAEEAADLGRSLHLEGPFQVHGAVLRDVDLQAAASLVKSGERSSDTRFDELSGQLVLDRGVYRFSRLKASSGALAARGELTLSPKKALSGRVELQAMGGAADVPLDVSGTMEAPKLAPTGASIAGAAVGTAVLGPGLGTTVGAKIGAVTEKIFGGDDKKKE